MAPDTGNQAPFGSVLELRALLAERFPRPAPLPRAYLATGLSHFDQISEGGLLKGAITELISPRLSTGSGRFIYTLLQTAWRDRYFIALIDGFDSFDPQPFENSQLRHLLWVRCRKTMEAVKAADLLLRDGNFPLVILDLVLNPTDQLRKIPQTTWYRLQRLVESVPTAFLVLTRHRMVISTQRKVILENSWTLNDLEKTTVSPPQLQLRPLYEGHQIRVTG